MKRLCAHILVILMSVLISFFGHNTIVHAEEETELQKTINTYIVEVYKLQGRQILDELDINLQKVAPTNKARLDAYTSIQETLILRRDATQKDTEMTRNTRNIVINYLNYMIQSIDKKKAQLQ